MKQKRSREAVIEMGTEFLRDAGAESICKVCISGGGSCCISCQHLIDRVGCQKRNTSCTAWLCGFHNYILFELNLLEEWNNFWDEVPGKDFRKDETPEFFFMTKSLSKPDIRHICEAFAKDLDVLASNQIAIGFILTLREKLDRCIELTEVYRYDQTHRNIVLRKIKSLSSLFTQFNLVLQEYRLESQLTDTTESS
ncbi:hypothetical protein [Paenibacillus sp. OV219]|uniref:hypothetical protein n=1 Tax=Paenibacillus sp. OV219 TaxID=1884377 RepID=UPI0008C4BB35|nr:hypothetical protein [Paenibacillus sp. OV219]SEO53603.1 hypothetical protein SAMN05518847_108194 [Paenibacillus sp. OV219]